MNERTRKRSAAGGMERSGSLCGRGCRSAGAVAWRFSAGAGDTIERQLPAGKAHSTIGKQLPPGKPQSTIGKQLHSAKHDTIEKQLPPGTAQSTIGKQLHSAKQGTFGTSNLPNQQHREEHFLSNNGAKRAGAEVVRGSNLACFLRNFVSNYIVIFLMMLFRVHL